MMNKISPSPRAFGVEDFVISAFLFSLEVQYV
ncbi:hypothetical protein SMU103_00170 [Streptococcus mutans SA38]|nr:hypothetical protein SMU103_00170 [Streptococcus mutans SA38]